METNYDRIIDNYASNKKEELKDLQLKLLEQDHDIADIDDEQLLKYQ